LLIAFGSPYFAPITCGSRFHGDHGAFDARARSWNPQLWTSEHRGWVATGVVALAVSGLLAFLKKK
jgi:hypothetical protein